MSINRFTTFIFAGALLLMTAACEKPPSEERPKSAPNETTKQEPARPEQKSQTPPTADKTNRSENSDYPESLDELPKGVNAVQKEMQLLKTAMQTILTMIANDTLEGVPSEIKTLHPARQLTERAIKTGRYEPPVNADQMKQFKRLDGQFHRDLKGLLKAAKQDNLQKATTQYSKLVNGCTECHSTFRFK